MVKVNFFKETKRPYEDTHLTVFNRQNLIYLLFKGMLYRHSPIKVSSCIDENWWKLYFVRKGISVLY